MMLKKYYLVFSLVCYHQLTYTMNQQAGSLSFGFSDNAGDIDLPILLEPPLDPLPEPAALEESQAIMHLCDTVIQKLGTLKSLRPNQKLVVEQTLLEIEHVCHEPIDNTTAQHILDFVSLNTSFQEVCNALKTEKPFGEKIDLCQRLMRMSSDLKGLPIFFGNEAICKILDGYFIPTLSISRSHDCGYRTILPIKDFIAPAENLYPGGKTKKNRFLILIEIAACKAGSCDDLKGIIRTFIMAINKVGIL